MAGRPAKIGLDYFELDCHMEEKVRLIQAEFGYKSFAIVVKLYQKIYGEFGYYCEWNEDSLLLFMSENGVSSCEEKNYIKEVVAACIRRNIFSEEIYKKYSVLTSAGVQKRYLNAVSKRESVNLKKEYLLISVGKNQKNVAINSISDGINSISSVGNSQSRVDKIKEDNKPPISPLQRFDEFLSVYPKPIQNRHIVEAAYRRLLEGEESCPTEESLITAVKNYAETVRLLGTEERYIKNPENFLKDNFWMAYTERHYKPPKPSKKGNSFNNYPQRTYDFDKVEKILLERSQPERQREKGG